MICKKFYNNAKRINCKHITEVRARRGFHPLRPTPLSEETAFLEYYLDILKYFIHDIVLKKNYTLLKLISKKKLISLLKILKYSSLFRFDLLNHLTAQDKLALENRFLIYYMLRSISYNHQIIIELSLSSFGPAPAKVASPSATSLKYSCESIQSLYPSADWFERELFDMFGIFFINHKDLRRILTDYGFKHHPLRKDFPLIGFKEIRYDDRIKTLLSEDIELSQIRIKD